jgi:3-oxoacyl-(acyl-carrier-protein) synthase
LSRIVVTGMGIISAIGDSVDANRSALMEGKCGVSHLELFASKYAGLLPCAEIKIDNETLSNKLDAHDPGITRTTLLALHAVQEAIQDAGLSPATLRSSDTALIGASTVGGMCLTDELYHDSNRPENGSQYLSSYDCGSASLYLQARYQIGGVINTINTACSSSANAIMFGARLIQRGLATRAIVGGTDSLAKFTINGFNALRILSPEVCRPFDEGRKGLNLGEGAAFLVLEKESETQVKKAYAEIRSFCNTNDAFHPSSLSENGEGPFLAMRGALEMAELEPRDIGFINAHGTGTENNDESESRAMIRLFGVPPPFASTKSNTGHSLGASGAMEALFSILSLYNQEVYPSLHFSKAIASTGLEPVGLFRYSALQHVMSNSFGFGGNCSSLIFSTARA